MPSPHAALIVDPDPRGLESLVYGFQGAEWRMTACPSPETASLLVKASGAHIVVVASRTDHEKTHTLARQLRAKEAFRTLPVLVLGPEELREPLGQYPDVDLLVLPAFVRDVLTACELLVSAGTAAQKPGQEPCFVSPISRAKTMSLMRSMNGLSRSGQLRLVRRGRWGEILFHQGEPTAATAGQLQGMDAVQHLMVWNDGELEVRLRHVPRRGQIPHSGQDFLGEIERFERDLAHATKDIGPETTAYVANPERLIHAAGAVPAEVTPVLRLCDGRHTLSDIIDESPFRVLDTARILGRLAELAVVTRADGKPTIISTSSPSPGDAASETAQIVATPSARPEPPPAAGIPAYAPGAQTAFPEPQAPGKAETKAQAPIPDDSGSAPEPRPRRRTLEIGLPGPATPPPVQPPAPAGAAPPAAQSRATADKPGTGAPQPAARDSGPITAKAATPAPAPRPTATLLQASGAAMAQPAEPAPAAKPAAPAAQTGPTPEAKPISPGLAAKLGVPVTQPSSSVKQPGPTAPATSPTATLLQAGGVAAAKPATPAPPSPTTTLLQAAGAIAAKVASYLEETTRGTPAPRTPVAVASPTPSSAAPAKPDPVSMQAGGVIESPKNGRHTQKTMRAVEQRPSVVIEAVADENVKTPLPAAIPAAGPGRAPALSPSPEEIAARVKQAPTAGVLELAPPRRTAVQSVPTIRASIQVDESLTPTPPPAAPSAPPSKSAADASRVAGEMHVGPSARTTRSMDKAAAGSFHIDPSLSAPAQPGRHDSRPVPPKRSDSQRTPGARSRPSGGFSAVESDFFEREAELYKEEKVESFADLDEDKPANKPRAKPGRPYRR
ncbi:MAG: DUF4388 domain-containing protein [Deltaproteobacteria bacterium]|nr:DUF4388 domain-containing protein [Deltaproteobacteria bacterium]